MEKFDLEAEKKRTAKAERSESPAISTRKMVNVLLLMGDRIPIGTKLSGEAVRSLVNQVEARGFTIPGDKFTVSELRSMQPAVDKAAAGITLPFETRTTTPGSKYTDEELNRRIAAQRRQFEAMLAEEEKADPLLKVANMRATRPTLKGKLSPEDQKLYDQHKKLSGRK